MELEPEHYDDGTIEQPSLRIKNATRFDQGFYICILENNVGSAQSENDIYVNITCKYSQFNFWCLILNLIDAVRGNLVSLRLYRATFALMRNL